MPIPTPPSTEQEEHVLKAALTECRRRLDAYRREGDTLAADIAEADLNTMLDRLTELSRGSATDATEATDGGS